MKFPSLNTFVNSIKNVLLRFPFEIGFALLGTLAATVLIEISELKVEAENFCLRLIMVANLGIVLSLSLSLFFENNACSFLKKILFCIYLYSFEVLLVQTKLKELLFFYLGLYLKKLPTMKK